MRRLILRWLALLVFVAVIATACVLLGRWQLARLEERRITNDIILARENAEPVPAQEAFDAPITEADQWQRVELTGTYDAENQFVVRLRTHDRQPGIEVVDAIALRRRFHRDGQPRVLRHSTRSSGSHHRARAAHRRGDRHRVRPDG